jgi:hypothetical protein
MDLYLQPRSKHVLIWLLPSSGRDAFQNLIHDGHVVGFERITSPINNNPNKTKTIRLIREHNPTRASGMPSPSWVVMQTEALFDMEVMRTLPGATTNPPVKSLVPKGAYETKAQADARVREVSAELMASIRGSRIVDRSIMTPGDLTLAVINDRSGDSPVGFSLMASCQ